ncbi:MAG TPA: amino acid permease [Burkholderiaceae bacterium]|nr:amino acid permease [Burkholderiaceae bacterium]
MNGTTPSNASPAGKTTAAPRPVLQIFDVAALVIGIVIGAGIFGVPSLVAANSGSVAEMLIAWLIGGLIALTGMMCYAELATAHPHSGGDYHFLRLAFGERLSFLFAWARLTVIPTGSMALLGYVFGDYMTQVLALGPLSSTLWAMVVIVMMTALNLIGVQAGKWTQNVLTLLQVGGVLIIIFVGLALAPSGPAAAAAAPATAQAVTNWGLVLVFVMLTYGGWNEAAYVSAEVVGPQRNLPRALFISLAIIAALYLLVNLAFVSVLGLQGMAGSRAVGADMMRAVLGDRGAQMISLLIAVAALTSVNATVLMGSRTTYAFGRDEPMFSRLGYWSPRFGTPVNALLVQAAIALALVLLGAVTRQGFQTMVEYTAPVFWFFFLMTGIALFVLRQREPDAARPYRVPLYPLTPLVFCASSAYLLYSSVVYTGVGALVGIAVLAVGALLLLVRPQVGSANARP